MDDDAREKDAARRREGININVSLTALTQCINSLVKGQHPSYRSSPLTHVLQDSLGGNSKTTLLVCASPHVYNRVKCLSIFKKVVGDLCVVGLDCPYFAFSMDISSHTEWIHVLSIKDQLQDVMDSA